MSDAASDEPWPLLPPHEMAFRQRLRDVEAGMHAALLRAAAAEARAAAAERNAARAMAALGALIGATAHTATGRAMRRAMGGRRDA